MSRRAWLTSVPFFQLQFDGRHPSLLPEEFAGEAQGGEDVVGIVFGLLHGEDHAGGI